MPSPKELNMKTKIQVNTKEFILAEINFQIKNINKSYNIRNKYLKIESIIIKEKIALA